MAEQLLAAGEKVVFLGLIDTNAGSAALADVRETFEKVERYRGTGLDETAALKATMGHLVDPTMQGELEALAATGDVSRMVPFLVRIGLLPADLDGETLRRLLRMQMGIMEGIYRYQPPTLPVQVTLFRSAHDGSDPTMGWDAVLPVGLHTVVIGGDHHTLLNPPHVERLGEALMNAL
jgi:thioesterase domain-containing protein